MRFIAHAYNSDGSQVHICDEHHVWSDESPPRHIGEERGGNLYDLDGKLVGHLDPHGEPGRGAPATFPTPPPK